MMGALEYKGTQVPIACERDLRVVLLRALQGAQVLARRVESSVARGIPDVLVFGTHVVCIELKVTEKLPMTCSREQVDLFNYSALRNNKRYFIACFEKSTAKLLVVHRNGSAKTDVRVHRQRERAYLMGCVSEAPSLVQLVDEIKKVSRGIK